MPIQDVDVAWFLKQWDGQYNTEWQSTSDVVVRFTTPQALKEALTALGGGIRGVFRVDRGYAHLFPACRESGQAIASFIFRHPLPGLASCCICKLVWHR